MDRNLISIIVPTYNASKCIGTLINSVLHQTYKNFELIIIDDGSTDSTYNICKSIANKDKRIKVYTKKNGGVSSARQYGINLASGEFSIHADADDWMNEDMLENLYKEAIENSSDIVIADFYIKNGNKESLSIQKPNSLKADKVLQDLFNNKLFGSLWNKLIRTELYKKYNAQFFYGINHCEDLLLLAQLLQHNEIKISYCSKAFYHYVFNPNSITNNYTYETYKTRLKFRNKLKEILVCSNSKEIIEKVSFGIFIEAFIYDVLSKKEIKEGLKQYKSNISKIESTRWKLGFLFCKLGLYSISRKLIKY